MSAMLDKSVPHIWTTVLNDRMQTVDSSMYINELRKCIDTSCWQMVKSVLYDNELLIGVDRVLIWKNTSSYATELRVVMRVVKNTENLTIKEIAILESRWFAVLERAIIPVVKNYLSGTRPLIVGIDPSQRELVNATIYERIVPVWTIVRKNKTHG